jgi:hypothetical protein
MEKRFKITLKEAINLLPKEKEIHTFRQNRYALIGCDWNRENLIEALTEHKNDIVLAGENAAKMNHGMAIFDPEPLFIETNESKLEELELLISKEVN